MGFFSKLFKNSGEQIIREQPGIEEPIKEKIIIEQRNEEPIIEQEKNYTFEFALTDESMRDSIIEFISPIKSQSDVLNLQLAYGVFEKNINLCLVRRRVRSSRDDDTGEANYTTEFVAIVDGVAYPVSYTSKDLHAKGELAYDVPAEYNELLIKAFDYYRNWEGHREFEKKFAQENQGMNLNSFNSKLNKALYDMIPKKDTAVKKDYQIDSLEDAKEFFYLCNKDCHRFMKENYTEQTIQKFNELVDSEQKKKWIAKECEDILDGIISGDMDKLYKKLGTVSGMCDNWLSEPYNLAEKYVAACQVIFASDAYVPLVCINSYLGIFKKRFNPKDAEKIIELTENYLLEKRKEDFESVRPSDDIQKFKTLAMEIRGMIAELAPALNQGNFEFVSMDKVILEEIAEWFKNKYNDVAAVKETLAELNCVYGVRNERIFITSASHAADSLNNQSWDKYDFIAVLLDRREVVDFRCKRGKSDGRFAIEYCSSNNLPEETVYGVEYFRNNSAREEFFEKYSKDSGKNILIAKSIAHKEFFKSLGSSFQELLDRIGNNPLGKTLEEFVELCEAKAPEYGFDNIVVAQPASTEDITIWEEKNEIRLSESFKNFLIFANGFNFKGSSEYIFGLNQIIVSSDYIEPDYMIIGGIIGDGTTLCLSKITKEAYIEDHGEYTCYGDFENLLQYVIELAFG